MTDRPPAPSEANSTKIATIIGARPQFIKAWVVSSALSQRGRAQEVMIHTGQHYDENMSGCFFSELGMPSPAYNLGISGGTHAETTAHMMMAIERVLIDEKPDKVLVYGDTNSTLAGALAASKLHLPIYHVEAGLRSGNRRMPEEINRIVTDHLSTGHFAPTKTAVKNLFSEGFSERSVVYSGDVMLDAALMVQDRFSHDGILEKLDLDSESFALSTLHRAENTDDSDRLQFCLSALDKAGDSLPVVLPLHPRTRLRMAEFGLQQAAFRNIRFIDPVSYVEMAALLTNAKIVFTDSGGVQKEAYFHQKPSVILRPETEWVEIVIQGWSRLFSEVTDLRDAVESFKPNSEWSTELFGNGHAAEKIAQYLCES